MCIFHIPVVIILFIVGIESQFVDIQNIVDVRKQRNFEIAIRITTDIVNTDRTFYTDLNGFQVIFIVDFSNAKLILFSNLHFVSVLLNLILTLLITVTLFLCESAELASK
jgi:hypothetical protein